VLDDDADALAAPERHADTAARQRQAVLGVCEINERLGQRHGYRHFDELSAIRHAGGATLPTGPRLCEQKHPPGQRLNGSWRCQPTRRRSRYRQHERQDPGRP
jgi:hypothetical protein